MLLRPLTTRPLPVQPHGARQPISRSSPRGPKARSPSREPGAPPEARRGRPRRRRPPVAARAPPRAAPAAQVGGDLADGRVLRVVLLVAAALPLPDAARLLRVARR